MLKNAVTPVCAGLPVVASTYHGIAISAIAFPVVDTRVDARSANRGSRLVGAMSSSLRCEPVYETILVSPYSSFCPCL